MYSLSPTLLPRTASYSSTQNEQKLKQRYTPSVKNKTNFYQTYQTQYSTTAGSGFTTTDYNNNSMSNSQQGFRQENLYKALGIQGNQQISVQLSEIIQKRKKNDKNLQLIQNRNHQLRLQQQRTLKKADQDEKQSKNLVNGKKNFFQRKFVKTTHKERMQQQIEEKRQEIFQRKNEYINNKKLYQEKLEEKKQLQYKFYQAEKQRMKGEYNEMVDELHRRKQSAFRQIKDDEIKARQLLEQFQEQKNRHMQQIYQAEIEKELQRIEYNQRLIQMNINEEKENLRQLEMAKQYKQMKFDQLRDLKATPYQSIFKSQTANNIFSQSVCLPDNNNNQQNNFNPEFSMQQQPTQSYRQQQQAQSQILKTQED